MMLKKSCFRMRVIILVVVLILNIFCGPAFAGWEPLSELKAPDPCEDAHFGYSVSIDNGTGAIGAPGRNNNQGAVYVCDINGPNNWNYVTTLLPPDLNDTDQFGFSVSIDSNKIVVGVNAEGADEVYVFDYNGTEWNADPEVLSIVSPDAYYGKSVSIDGNTIVVGAMGNAQTQTGAAYVFDYNGTEWNYEQELTDPCGVNGDSFGYSVAVDGDVIVVGAESDDADSDEHSNYGHGSVSMFRYSSGTWTFEQKFKYPDIDHWTHLGDSVSVSGDTIAAGAYQYSYGGYSRAGAVYVYKYNGSSWEQNTILLDPNPETSDYFGTDVAIDGNRIVVGNRYHDGSGSNSGAAYLFEYDGSSWSQGQILEDPCAAASDYFGCSVAIDGDTALVGAKYDDGGQNNAGAVHVFLFLVADLNRDGLVNFKDFAILAGQWFQEPGVPSADIAPLSGGDNIVNMLDLRMLVGQWLRIGSPYIPSP
jgi:hypothetical protein